VIVGTLKPVRLELPALREKADELVKAGILNLPGFTNRLVNFQPRPPANYQRCPILLDDFAPVDGLMRGAGESAK